jgi:hypothetical protein
VSALDRAYADLVLEAWLIRLGMLEWRVSVDWHAHGWADSDLHYAQVMVPATLLTTTIRLNADRSGGWDDDLDLNETIVHELLHLAMRDVEQLVDSLLEHLLPMARELGSDRWRHAEELVVERLARVLVALGGVIPRVAFDAA